MESGLGFSRLFGLGLHVEESVVAQTVDELLWLANLSFTVYGWDYVTSFLRLQIPAIWDPSAVMVVVKVCTYLLTPPVTLAAWLLKKRELTRLVRRLDEIARPPTPSFYSAAARISLSTAVELTMFFLYQFDTDFRHFSPIGCLLIVVYNVWFNVPLLRYAALMDAIRRTVREINGRIATVGAWKRYRGRWKELGYAAVRLARNDFGVIIVAFVVCQINAIVFFLFNVYFIAYKLQGIRPCSAAVFAVNFLFNVYRLVEIFRVTHNCRMEILKTKTILSSVNVRTGSDHKELKYAFLFMLHEDVRFIPCDIFELSYSTLLKIATLILGFVICQIQMKLR